MNFKLFWSFFIFWNISGFLNVHHVDHVSLTVILFSISCSDLSCSFFSFSHLHMMNPTCNSAANGEDSHHNQDDNEGLIVLSCLNNLSRSTMEESWSWSYNHNFEVLELGVEIRVFRRPCRCVKVVQKYNLLESTVMLVHPSGLEMARTINKTVRRVLLIFKIGPGVLICHVITILVDIFQANKSVHTWVTDIGIMRFSEIVIHLSPSNLNC